MSSFSSSNINAQCTGEIFLPDQAAVDNFANDYGCTVIEGHLIIGNTTGATTDITDLSGLAGLTTITGSLRVLHNVLTSLDGLEGITEVGMHLVVCDNHQLLDISALSNVTNIGGDLKIMYNSSLGVCCLVPLLTTVTNGNIILHDNQPSCNSEIQITVVCGITDNSSNCDPVSFIDPIPDFGQTSICADGSNLPTVPIPQSSLPNTVIVMSINDTIFDIDNNTLNVIDLGSLNLTSEDEVCYTAFSYDSIAINEVLTLAGILCPGLNDAFPGLDPCTPVAELLAGDNDGIPGVNTLDEAFYFASNFVGEIYTIDEAINALQLLNLNIDQLGLSICFAANFLPVCLSVDEECMGSRLSVRAFLEGPYQEESQTMSNDLRSNDLLPLSHPYNIAPWNLTENDEGFSVENMDNLPENAVDWVLIELRTGQPNNGGSQGTTTIASKPAILLTDGNIVAANGSPLTFSDLDYNESYYVVLRHRNHLDVMSSIAIEASDDMVYDFTPSVAQAFSNTQLKDIDGMAVLYAGDLSSEGIIQISDYDCWKTQPAAIDVYSVNDANLDGTIQISDYDKWYGNRSKMGCVEICY